jgi:hypothetical protein
VSRRRGTINCLEVARNFHLSEFECRKGGSPCGHCGGAVVIDPRVILFAQILREEIGRALRITSGFRCIPRNIELGGVLATMDPWDPNNSFHVQGMAIDVSASGIGKRELAEAAIKVGWPRVGYYQKRGIEVVHLDVADPRVTGLPSKWGNLW